MPQNKSQTEEVSSDGKEHKIETSASGTADKTRYDKGQGNEKDKDK